MNYYGNGANVVSTYCRNPVRLLCKTHTRTVVSMMSATTATVKPAEFVHCSPEKPISVEYRGCGRVKWMAHRDFAKLHQVGKYKAKPVSDVEYIKMRERKREESN